LPSHFHVVTLVLIDYLISQVLALSGKQREKRAAESAQVAKIVELEVVSRSQADKITELEVTCTDLKCEKDKVTDGYRSLAEKHKALAKKPNKKNQNLRRPMLLSLISFTKIWIWRHVAIQSIFRMCAIGFASFMRQLLHHLMKSKRNVCPSPTKA
jgi:uncharacterized coiled-coil protein SlyX